MVSRQDDHVAFDALRDGHGLGNRSRHVLHFIKHAGTVSRLDSDNPPIGLFADLSQTCTMLQTPFLPGDRLVLYTDGITESIASDGSELGIDGLERYVTESAHRPLEQFAQAIRHRVEKFRGSVRRQTTTSCCSRLPASCRWDGLSIRSPGWVLSR